MGKSSINGQFSMAMLNNKRVIGVLLWYINQLLTGGPHPVPTIEFSVPNQLNYDLYPSPISFTAPAEGVLNKNRPASASSWTEIIAGAAAASLEP